MFKSTLTPCLAAITLTACRWHGIHPVDIHIEVADQLNQAPLVVFARAIESRPLTHWETIPNPWVLKNNPAYRPVPCQLIEKVLQVSQVLKGTLPNGPTLKVQTYEIKGVPGIANQPAIFFLKEEAKTWRPLADFGSHSAISLPGFPSRRLVLSGKTALPTSGIALDRVIIDALLDPQNAIDWPEFKDALQPLNSLASNLASRAGILEKEPELITDKLTTLMKSPNPGVVAQAKRIFVESTGLCHGPLQATVEEGYRADQENFATGRRVVEMGTTREDHERAYWNLESYSCSPVPLARAKARILLRRYFPEHKTTPGCEICPQ